jgi:tetratricopeptide (TPR) repeat protein
VDTAAGNYAAAIKGMQDATAAKPDESILWDVLGDAQLDDAVAADNAAKAAKTVDPTVKDKLAAAVASYQKALTLNAASDKPNAETTAAASNQLGSALGRLGKTQEAADAYDAAAKADPKNAVKYYINESVTLYNVSVTTGKADGLVEAADKAIAADPTRADAYFFKAEGLAPLITMGSDGKTLVAPPGLVDACNMYLKLAPAGVHAGDMKGILAGLQEQVQTNYKAPATTPAKKK